MNNSRRHFLKKSTGILPLLLVPSVFSNCSNLDGSKVKIEAIDLYLINVKKERHFSYGVWKNRQHVMLSIKAGGHTGWGETKVSSNNPDFDLKNWAAEFSGIKGMDLNAAIEKGRNSYFDKKWSAAISEGVLMTLYDLMGKIANKPTIKMWGLQGDQPIPAIFCILEKNAEAVVIQAKIAKDQNMHRYVKIKMFGDFETDKKNISALRAFLGPDSFIVGDPNRGYKYIKDLDQLINVLIELNEAGMNAIEDPSSLSKEEFIYIQSKVGELSIIPDHIMRPAKKSIEFFDSKMGDYFNFHPNTMGTFLEINKLSSIVRASKKGIMIGDSSLVGAACTFWQQLAVGNEASWVEAMEKPQENDSFLNCVIDKATYLNSEGKVEVKFKPGFGLKVDEKKLLSLADSYLNI